MAADIDRFLADAVAAWDVPGQVLALVETAARDAANRIGQALIQHALQVPASQETALGHCDQGHRVRMVGVRPRTIRTALGPVVLQRRWWHCDACHTGFAPVEDRYGVSAAGTSPGFDRILALSGSEQSYRVSDKLITELTGLRLAPPSAVARTTRRIGARAADQAQVEAAAVKAGTLVPLVATPVPDVCYVLIDGTGAPMVPAETAGRPGKGPDGRSRTREVKIGCLFTQARPGTVEEPPVQDRGSASYIETFEPADRFAGLLHDEYRRRGFDRVRQPVVIADGAKWIWKIADRLFPEATPIVDYWHACEHVHNLVKIFDHILPDPTGFTNELIGHLDTGNINAIVAAVDALGLDSYKGRIGQQTRTALEYFTSNAHRMRYQHYRDKGWFIGSGPVEAACKIIVADRAKKTGMRWTIPGLNPVLTLRALTRSGRDHLIWGNDLSQTPLTTTA